MPELPEVETTVKGLRRYVVNKTIKNVWTDLNTNDKRKHDTVANPKYFSLFKKSIEGKKIISVERVAKNILLNLNSGEIILIHMKLTGHLLYGKYSYSKKNNKWLPPTHGPLADSFNKYIHVVFSFSQKEHLAFSDMRKFGKITLLDTNGAHDSKHLKDIGRDPLDKTYTWQEFKSNLNKKSNRKIKTVLMDQTVIAGIGNIYSDEILWRIGIHPERIVKTIKGSEIKKVFKTMRILLSKGIDLGGDSMSDYRNISGEKGTFQLHHEAYGRKGEKCHKKNCSGIIERKIINGRSAHFCNNHQK